jgi:hypothetical protein
MSLILDALNRSSASTAQVPDLATQHYVENGADGSRGRRYLPWLALLGSLLVIGWLVLDRMQQPQPVATTITPPPETHRPQVAAIVRTPEQAAIAEQESHPPQAQPVAEFTRVEREVEREVEEEIVAQTQASTGDSAVADLYRKRPEPTSVAAKPAVQPAPEPTARSGVAPAVAGRPVKADVVEAAREEQPIDIGQMILKARNELENASLEEHNAPFIADLSQQTKDRIPSIFYERHDYSDDKSQSSVVCNGKILKVGGSPAAGVKVDEILPDSLVLSYQGTQFRLRALNSWVNL